MLSGVKIKNHSNSSFKHMNLSESSDKRRYLFGKLMYKVYDGSLFMLQFLLKRNNDFHAYQAAKWAIIISPV